MPAFDNLKEIAEAIASIKDTDGIPAYSVDVGQKFIYVCRNDGEFHVGGFTGELGFATFVGKFTFRQACEDWNAYRFDCPPIPDAAPGR